MISSQQDYQYYLACDRLALKRGKSRPVSFFRSLFFTRDLIWTFQRTLRLYEYYLNCRKKGIVSKVILMIISYRFRNLSVKLGFTIPPNVIGPGLSIAHRGTIVINSNARLGANCRIHVCVNIGAVGKSNKAPILGNNIYIGPGAKIYGEIEIGDNTVIGANAVVNKSFKDGSVVIAGVPAYVIGTSSVDDHLIRATELVNHT